ncbi:tachykinin [Nomia melanderi]|uniref:tachykinin n=1 Tax=Nomia melanderi TaxID=2448451 RepID=UPI0013043A9C|nr:tachykinins [Nomia melanderi]XP_031832293.1 tachykinins [Nomia melanderi]
MIVRSSFLLITTIAFTFAADASSNSIFSAKQDPMGFKGMAEKKSFASAEGDEMSKRASMGFQGMRGKKDSITSEIEHEIQHEIEHEFDAKDTDKPAPMVFQNTRGQKDTFNFNFEDSYVPADAYEKKAYYKQDEHYKRAPMGFQGMRGKKSLEQILNEIEKRTAMESDYSEDYETRMLPMLMTGSMVQPMTMTMATDRYQGSVRDKKDTILEEWEKRAPMGFQGTRGKKAVIEAIEQLGKKALMGFHGMRGKKDTFVSYLDYPIVPSEYAKRSTDFNENYLVDPLKRARMGFHGMRGKRDATQVFDVSSSYRGTNNDRFTTNQVAAYEIKKRSPYRYVGVRGKKNPRWEFRGKFVGVRGKKSSSLQDQPVF